MKTRTSIPNLMKSEFKDDLTNSDSEKAELLAYYFSSLFTREPQDNTPEEFIRCHNTVETKLETFKSPGPDGIHPRVFNELADCTSIPLSTIFNTSLTTGKLPLEWKQANISPIHKTGSKTLPQNYQSVSITSLTFRRMRTASKQCSRKSWHKRQECLIKPQKGPVSTCKNL